MFGSGLLFKHEPITKEILIFWGKISIKTILYQMSITPIFILAGLISKNIIIPIVIGIISIVSNILIVAGNKFKYSPFALSLTPLFRASEKNFNLITTRGNIVLALTVFIVSSIFSIIYYLKADTY